MKREIKKIALVAGGTGGHIFPAISLEKWIEKNDENVSVIFFCGNRALEQDIYFSQGIKPIVLPVKGSPFFGSIKQKVNRSANIIHAFFRVFTFLREEKPDFVLFFGGYISFPVYFAAKLRSIPIATHEQNACAGKVTRLLAKLHEPILSGFKVCMPLHQNNFTYTGIPIREFDIMSRESAVGELGLPSEVLKCKVVLVLTGSLGSETIKNKLLSFVADEKFRDVQFILPATSEKLEMAGRNVWLLPKIWKTELLFSIANVIIARAGASSLAEIESLKIPAIIIPWKEAKDNHQYYNACEFVKENEALLLREDEIQDKLEIMLNEILQKTKIAHSIDEQSKATFRVYNKIKTLVSGNNIVK